VDQPLIVVSPEEIQFGLLVTLHRQYMEDHRTPVVFMGDALTSDSPPWRDIERELIQLEHRGWIQFSSELLPDTVMCKLTPRGREVFEELVEGIARQAKYKIGFRVDEQEELR